MNELYEMFCGECTGILQDNFYEAQAAFLDGTMSPAMAREEMLNALVGWMDSECREHQCTCNTEGDRIVVRDNDDDVLFYGISGIEFDDFTDKFKLLQEGGIDALQSDYKKEQMLAHLDVNFNTLFSC